MVANRVQRRNYRKLTASYRDEGRGERRRRGRGGKGERRGRGEEGKGERRERGEGGKGGQEGKGDSKNITEN